MKKFTTILLTLSLMLAFAACDGGFDGNRLEIRLTSGYETTVYPDELKDNL